MPPRKRGSAKKAKGPSPRTRRATAKAAAAAAEEPPVPEPEIPAEDDPVPARADEVTEEGKSPEPKAQEALAPDTVDSNDPSPKPSDENIPTLATEPTLGEDKIPAPEAEAELVQVDAAAADEEIPAREPEVATMKDIDEEIQAPAPEVEEMSFAAAEADVALMALDEKLGGLESMESMESKEHVLEAPDSEGDKEVPKQLQEVMERVNDGSVVEMDQEQGIEQESAELIAVEGENVEGQDNADTGVDGDGDDIAGANEGDDDGDAGVGADEGDKMEDTDKSESDDEDEEDDSEFMHAPLSDKRKQKDFEIFIGGLSKEAVEDDLIKVFGEYGEVQSARIVKHQTSQKSKGFAFIRYATVEQAKKVLTELKDGIEVKGKRVGISASQDNDTLYLGNICKTWMKDNVITALKGYGIEQIDEIYLPEDPKNEGKIKGYAFVEFSTHSDAMAAFQRLKKPDAIFGRDRSAKVAFAPSSMHPSEEALSQVKTVFVEGLPESWDEEKVKEHCKQYGEIEKVQLSRYFTNARRRDFGFIAFTSRESAVACVEGINNAQLGEGEIKVKANIAKPQNKGRLAKQGARGGFKVKSDGENNDASGSNTKGKAKYENVGKGKDHSRAKTGRGSKQPLRLQGPVAGGRGGVPFQYHQKRDQPFISGKRKGGRFMDNARPPLKKPRENRSFSNMHGRPSGKPSGYQNNPHFGKSKKNFNKRPAQYWNSYPPMHGAATSSYQGGAYGAVPGSKHPYSHMEPHAGYAETAGRQSRGAYGYGQGSTAGGYNVQGTSASGGYAGGSGPQPSHGPTYSGYAGYEGGYVYPNNAGYPPSNNATYPSSNNVAYPPNNAGYPPSSSAAYPPNNVAYPPPPHGAYY